jgi:hypothetical protein
MMNGYQKAAILALRLWGLGLIIVAIMGFASLAWTTWKTGGWNDATVERAVSIVVYMVSGVTVVVAAGRLGQWLGSDLE